MFTCEHTNQLEITGKHSPDNTGSTFLLLRQPKQPAAYLMLPRRGPGLARERELVPPWAQRLFKAMSSNTSPPGSTRVTRVFKVSLSGKNKHLLKISNKNQRSQSSDIAFNAAPGQQQDAVCPSAWVGGWGGGGTGLDLQREERPVLEP